MFQLLALLVLIAGASAANPNLRWFSVWELESGPLKEISGWNNFLFTTRNVSLVQAYHTAGNGASLLNIDSDLFNGTVLYSDVDVRWRNLFSTIVQPLMRQKVLFGVFLGDELCWRCISYANLTYAVNMIRASIPRGQGIIFYNEAFPVFTNDVCGSMQGPRVGYARVPAGLDWIAMDYYPDEGTFAVCCMGGWGRDLCVLLYIIDIITCIIR